MGIDCILSKIKTEEFRDVSKMNIDFDAAGGIKLTMEFLTGGVEKTISIERVNSQIDFLIHGEVSKGTITVGLQDEIYIIRPTKRASNFLKKVRLFLKWGVLPLKFKK